jgi:hypothetical protein
LAKSASDAMRRIADLMEAVPNLPDYIVTVHSDTLQIGVLFGAGPDEQDRQDAVRRVLACLGGVPETGSIEYGGSGTLGPYAVEVSTGFD